MKTLIIHPNDRSTDFLSCIYENLDCTIINTNTSNSNLKKQIKDHDRIIMLGHGSENGLFGYNKIVIESKFVYLLKNKECVAIWCNADIFFKKYKLKGFYTGMIISEYEEALDYVLYPTTLNEIEESNILFAKAITENITSSNMLEKIQEIYIGNNIIEFNRLNLYITEDSFFK